MAARPLSVTEAEARAVLRAFVAVGEVEHWIAAQPWLAAPGGWVVPEPFHGLRFRQEPVHDGVRVVMSACGGSAGGVDCAEPAGTKNTNVM